MASNCSQNCSQGRRMDFSFILSASLYPEHSDPNEPPRFSITPNVHSGWIFNFECLSLQWASLLLVSMFCDILDCIFFVNCCHEMLKTFPIDSWKLDSMTKSDYIAFLIFLLWMTRAVLQGMGVPELRDWRLLWFISDFFSLIWCSSNVLKCK